MSRRGAGRGTAARALLATLALLTTPAVAQPASFRQSVEVYLMGASMAGTVGLGPLETEIDVPASAIFENLDFAGYRALDQDYESGGGSGAFTWDVLQQGPIVALGLRF